MSIQNHSFNVEPLGRPTAAHQITLGGSAVDQVLSSSCNRISIKATGCACRYLVGNNDQSSSLSATSHFIAQDERMDIAVQDNGHICAKADAGAGVLEISELV